MIQKTSGFIRNITKNTMATAIPKIPSVFPITASFCGIGGKSSIFSFPKSIFFQILQIEM